MDALLFKAILAMDSYNRGYGAALNLEPATMIGTATILDDSSNRAITMVGQGVGFYATAYQWGSQTIISYRGTDGFGTDILYGYPTGAGLYSAQGELAAKFYFDVVQNSGDRVANPNVWVTGHSLGAGLAGLAAALYGANAVLFDTMPFEDGAALTLNVNQDAYLQTGSSNLFGTENIASREIDLGGISHYYMPAATLRPWTNLLDTIRPNPDLPGAAYELPEGAELGWSSRNLVGQRHSNTLLVIRMFGAGPELDGDDWEAAAPYFMPALFNEEVATAAGASAIDASAEESPDRSGAMSAAIAYSAIDEGTLVFGDTGIRQLYDDADDLGAALNEEDVSSSIKESANSIAKIFVQYSGKLAIGKVTDNAAIAGVLTNANGVLSIDFATSLWAIGAAHDGIVGRETLITRALSDLSITLDILGEPDGTRIRSDLLNGLEWFKANNSITATTVGELIDRVSFQIHNVAYVDTIPSRPVGAASDRLSLFVSGDLTDQITGTSQNDFIYASKGIDIIDGGAGDDVLAGGEDDDTFRGGTGQDFFAGGDGIDTIDVGYETAFVGADLTLTAIDPWNEHVRSAFDLTMGGVTDRGIDIERITLSGESDIVHVGYLGHVDGDEVPMGSLVVDFKAGPVAYKVDHLDFSAAGRPNATTNLFGAMSADAGVYVDLSDAADQSVHYYYNWGAIPIWGDVHTVGYTVRMRAANANSVEGTLFDDYLIGNGGRQEDGEGYSTLYGGQGNDTLVGAGWESHLYGGSGDDTFSIGASTWVEDAEVHDRITYGLPIFGGVMEHWMEGGTAYWAPMSTLSSAFPVIGAEMMNAAAMFIDALTMPFASFQIDIEGNLVMKLGWGHGGLGVIRDYHLDLDSGLASAGVVVFAINPEGTATSNGKDSEDRFTQFLNLALKAAFGIGVNGYDPLVLDLDGDGYELTTEANSHAYFEFDNDGFGERTGWVRGDDGLLALDANANGTIDGVTELFGNQTTSGFAMLAAYDLNSDGVINASDAIYADLKVWRDLDQDGVTDSGELSALSALDIVSISLANNAPAEPTAIGGNQIASLGSFTRGDSSTGGIADVAFTINHTASRWLGDATVSTAAAALPQLKGFGEVKDLRVAMTGDAALEGLVADFVANATNDLTELEADAEAILYRWAGVDGVAADAIGTNGFDARKLAFLEAYSGYALMPRDGNGDVLLTNIDEMEALWADQVTRLTLRLVVQGPMADAFDAISYDTGLDLLVADSASALGDLYRGLLEDLPSNAGDALAQWQAWAPLLGAMADGMRRFDANVVRSDYVAAQLLAAMDGVDQPLDFETLAAALGVANLNVGTAGNDTLERGEGSGTAIYLGAGGTDLIEGGTGQDVYIFGETIGHVTIDDEENKGTGDRLRFAFLNAADVSLERDGDDLLITVTATDETVRVLGQFADVVPLGSDIVISSDKGIEDIQFADGTIFEMPEIMTAVGTGSAGDDHIVGTMHMDVLIGGQGDDLLEGGDNADLYVVNAGDGHDVIHDEQTTVLLRAGDLLIFGDGIVSQDLAFTRAGNGDDLLITIGGAGQSILIEDQFGYTSLGYNYILAPNSRIEAFAFRDIADNWAIWDLQRRLIADATTDGDDVTLGFGDNDVFRASAGDDLLIGLDGQDRYQWGMGSGDDVIDEQSRYIDINVGLGGLTLIDAADTVQFTSGLVQASIVFSRTASNDLTITILATGETLTIVDQFAGFQTGPLGAQWLDRIEWFEFGDGTRISWQGVLADVTTGGDGDDSLWGDLYADRLVGGLGNDILSGEGYGDTYVFGLGDGEDVLADNNASLLDEGFITLDSNPDVLELGPGITESDIAFERDGDDIVLVIGEDGDRVTLQGQDDYFHTGVFGAVSLNRIEEIHFDDETVWTWQELNARILAAATTAGDDVIDGFTMADRFEASAGNDILRGGNSADTYVFGEGSDDDIIQESVTNVLYGDQDVVEFAAGVLPEDVTVSRDGDDLILTLASGDTLTIEGEFAYSAMYTWSDVELFRFANAVEWTKADVQATLLASTAGDDHLVGFGSNDLLDGGAGNDILEGRDGSDIYHFGIGSGDDVVREALTNMNLGEDDRLVFGPGVLVADVAFARDDDDLVVTIISTGETLTVEGQFNFSNWFAWNDIEHFDFVGGVSLTHIEVAAAMLGGTPGDDHLIGTFRSDTLDGGAGTDLLEGGDGSDLYLFGTGYGQDEIRESLTNVNLGESDELRFGAGLTLEDLAFVREGDDLVISIVGTSDTVTLVDQWNFSEFYTWEDVERFSFHDGSYITKGDVQVILLQATSGADHLLGFMTGDMLDGGAGDDLLEGGNGSDTYVFGRGYGDDIVRETVTTMNLSSNDRLIFGADISLEDLAFAHDGNDLVITITGTSDSLRIEDQWAFVGNSTHWDIETFEFADASTLTKAEVEQMLVTGGSGDDHIIGFSDADTIDGGAGDDLLEGRDGADTYLFGRGSGHDTIVEIMTNGNISEYDTVLFAADVAPEDVAVSRDGYDLILTLDTGETLTVTDHFVEGSSEFLTHWDIDRVLFANGTSWDKAEIAELSINPTAGDDLILGNWDPNFIDALGGNDTIYAGAGSDTLTGGAGDDLLHGQTGSDTYHFGLGDGDDIIEDSTSPASGGSNDLLILGSGILPADVTVALGNGGRDLVLTFAGSTDSVTLKNTVTDTTDRIDSVQFANGTIWSHAAMLALAVGGTPGDDVYYGDSSANTLNGAGGNDTLEGRSGNDTLIGGPDNDIVLGDAGNDLIDGGPGNDLLRGGGNDDTYVFASGDGQDVVRDHISNTLVNHGGTDTVELPPEIAPGDVTVVQGDTGNDFILTFSGSSDQITLDDTIDDGGSRIEYVRFADGTIWTHADLMAHSMASNSGNDAFYGGYDEDILTGGAGDDTLVANRGDDVLTGGIGNDLVRGGGGDDLYHFNLGDGQDIVRDFIANTLVNFGGEDAVILGAGITAGGVTIVQGDGGNDLILKINSTTDQVIFDNTVSSSSYRIEEVRFADATVWTHTQMVAMALSPRAGDDTYWGDTGANTLSGGDGADTIYGDDGNDILSGDGGNDVLRGESGADTLNGGDGNDTLYGGSGDDQLAGGEGDDIVISESGIDTVDGGAGSDTVDASALTVAITVDLALASSQANLGTGGIETWSNVENVLSGTGADTLHGNASANRLVGGSGADTINGRDGNDTLRGGTSDDTLDGGAGDDVFEFALSDGFDTITGGTGYDIMVATAASIAIGIKPLTSIEEISGGGFAGVTLSGTSSANTLDFTGIILTGISRIDGFAGNDVITGSAGADTINGGTGDDTMNGGAGDDVFQFALSDGFDTITGGDGYDIMVATAASIAIGIKPLTSIEEISGGGFAGVTLSGTSAANTLDFTGIVLTGISRIDGFGGNDSITGSAGADIINGGTGDDTMDGGGGDDVFQYGTNDGYDHVTGGGGTDTLVATANNAWMGLRSLTSIEAISSGGFSNVAVWGSTSADTLNFSAVTLTGIVKIDGYDGNDSLVGSVGADTIVGGSGNDTIAGGLGNDSIDGGSGTDTVDYGAETGAWTINLVAASNQATSGSETDTLTAIENATGGSGADTITGTSAANVLAGGAGNDRITGGAGNDTIQGGLDSDVAVFAGLQASYSINTVGGSIQIVDNQTTTDGNDGTDTLSGVEVAEFKNGVQVGLSAPIVLDLDGDGVDLVKNSRSHARFDWNGDGIGDETGWIGKGDGILVYDRNHDGTVSNAREMSFLDDKPGARSDLDGLSAFDSNGDGRFSAEDHAWADFRVWKDGDLDGRVDAGELVSMAGARIASISLSGTATNQRWDWGDNIVVNHGQFTRTNGSVSQLADVAFSFSPSKAAAPAETHFEPPRDDIVHGNVLDWLRDALSDAPRPLTDLINRVAARAGVLVDQQAPDANDDVHKALRSSEFTLPDEARAGGTAAMSNGFGIINQDVFAGIAADGDEIELAALQFQDPCRLMFSDSSAPF